MNIRRLYRNSLSGHIIIFICVYFSLIYTASAFKVCVDPGHGGEDGGAPSAITGYNEKDVNLQIAILLKDSLEMGSLTGNYRFTRLTDTFIQLEDRPAIANTYEADAFLSIHHNGSTNPTVQYSWGYYCNMDTIPYGPYVGWTRKTTPHFAQKVLYLIRRAFRYAWNEPIAQNEAVLRMSYMASTISEASFISQPAEAQKFFNNEDGHRENEAWALVSAIYSYWAAQGIAYVDYIYQNPEYADSFALRVDGWDYKAPYRDCWMPGEYHGLEAAPFIKDGYYYQFHHWEHRLYFSGVLLFQTTDNPYEFFVDQAPGDTAHWYRAIFTGGPFDFNLIYPSAGMTEINKNDTLTII
ncbi:MAG: N-acetylmuramoyl-L-alanine amidase [candidate division Zixibacteria bacterium]|nr:N-acetylmuramoyl-L-alanine amidase [candidate division Zixibacteria bacterium]